MLRTTLLLTASLLLLLSIPTFADDVGQGKVVGLDAYFNHQVKNGKPYHYLWNDTANSGYSKFGEIWKQAGASITMLPAAPTADELKKLSVFIIVNPSLPKFAAGGKPNYIQPADSDAIAAWVHDGGVLALFANDVHNCELKHYSELAGRFGITFNSDDRNLVPTKADMKNGTFAASIFPDHPLFKDVQMIYMKEICTLNVQSPAEALLSADKQDGGSGKDIIMATSHYGKGLVFVVGDPWIYNEYIDVKSPSLPIENHKAAVNLVHWLLQESAAPQH